MESSCEVSFKARVSQKAVELLNRNSFIHCLLLFFVSLTPLFYFVDFLVVCYYHYYELDFIN